MSDRPILEHDGRSYERRAGDWVDVSTHMKVPINMSRQLDALAKSSTDLWDRCQQQDFTDDPRNRGKVLTIRHFDRPTVPVFSPQPLAGYQPAAQGRRHHHHSYLDYQIKGDSLILRCNVDGGWRPTARTWCFRESRRVELPGGYALRVTVALLEDTWGESRRQVSVDSQDAREITDDCESLDSVCPHFANVEKVSATMRWVLDEGTCACTIRLFEREGHLNPQLSWIRDGRHWTFRWLESGIYERPLRGGRTSVSRPFTIELAARLHEPPPSRQPPEYEGDTPFPSAGLPSLGKRK